MTLRVKLEIVPFGDEDRTYEIGRLDIFNQGPIGFTQYEYGVIEQFKGSAGLHKDTVLHRRTDGAWKLVQKVLNQLPIEGPK